jgi:hypothetical protein
MIRAWLLVLVLAGASSASAQEVLTNEGVIKLVKAGVSDDLVVNMVKTQPSRLSLTAEDMLDLQKNGVSERVMAAMIQKLSGASAPKAPSDSPAVKPADSPGQPPVSDIGVYYKSNSRWEDVLPETVTWQNWYMLVQGKGSKTKIAGPAEILIYTPSGVAVTEYQLLKLKERPTRREFMSFGGEVRGAIPFEAKKIASRTFLIMLTGLEPGEYAFMPPGAAQSANGAGSLGKLYTFQVIP